MVKYSFPLSALGIAVTEVNGGEMKGIVKLNNNNIITINNYLRDMTQHVKNTWKMFLISSDDEHQI